MMVLVGEEKVGEKKKKSVLFSEDPNLPSGRFSRFYWQNWQVLSRERSGGAGCVGDLLLPARWSFPKTFSIDLLIAIGFPQHIPWKLHPGDSGATLLWCSCSEGISGLEGVDLAPSIGHKPNPEHGEPQNHDKNHNCSSVSE